jgi:hypothetical protein
MGTNKLHAVTLAGWDRLITTLSTNTAALPDLEKARTDLQKKMEEARALIGVQGTHPAAKQDATKRIAQVMDDGRQLATFLRSGVKQRFGKESEKVIEFGVKPFRSKRRASSPQPPTKQPPEPPATGGSSGPTTTG